MQNYIAFPPLKGDIFLDNRSGSLEEQKTAHGAVRIPKASRTAVGFGFSAPK